MNKRISFNLTTLKKSLLISAITGIFLCLVIFLGLSKEENVFQSEALIDGLFAGFLISINLLWVIYAFLKIPRNYVILRSGLIGVIIVLYLLVIGCVLHFGFGMIEELITLGYVFFLGIATIPILIFGSSYLKDSFIFTAIFIIINGITNGFIVGSLIGLFRRSKKIQKIVILIIIIVIIFLSILFSKLRTILLFKEL